MTYAKFQERYHYTREFVDARDQENPARCCNFVCSYCVKVPAEPCTHVQLDLFGGGMWN